MKLSKLLLIEHNPEPAHIIIDILENMGHKIVYRHTGSEGLQAVQSEYFDGIVASHTLPDMDGLQLCRKIRETFKEVPIIFTPTVNSSVNQEVMLAAGATAFIPRPLSQNLAATISQHIHKHSLEGDAVKRNRNFMTRVMHTFF